MVRRNTVVDMFFKQDPMLPLMMFRYLAKTVQQDVIFRLYPWFVLSLVLYSSVG